MKTVATTTSLLALMAAWPALAQNTPMLEGEIGQAQAPASGDQIASDGGEPLVALEEWAYDPLYAEGWSVEDLMDAPVFGAGVDEIGSVENILFDSEGNIIALIAEVGGFWDIGDTHVAVPWDEVDITTLGESVAIPVSEENVDDYSLFGENVFFWNEELQEPTQVDDDLATGPEVFKATDLIGDMAYLTGNERYGYVSDLLVQNDQLRAVVVDASAYGTRGYYAYPYSPMGLGYGGGGYAGHGGWRYNLGYGAQDVTTIETYDYGQMQTGTDAGLQAN